MNEKTKADLAVAILASLPALTEEQVQFWVQNPGCLARVLNELAEVIIIQKSDKI